MNSLIEKMIQGHDKTAPFRIVMHRINVDTCGIPILKPTHPRQAEEGLFMIYKARLKTKGKL